MRPDSYRTKSPDAWEAYNEEGGNQNNNHFTFKDHALGLVALIFAALALGAVVMQGIKDPQITDAKIIAGAADAKATANQARTDARLALEQKNEDRIRMAVLEDRLNQRGK